MSRLTEVFTKLRNSLSKEYKKAKAKEREEHAALLEARNRLMSFYEASLSVETRAQLWSDMQRERINLLTKEELLAEGNSLYEQLSELTEKAGYGPLENFIDRTPKVDL